MGILSLSVRAAGRATLPASCAHNCRVRLQPLPYLEFPAGIAIANMATVRGLRDRRAVTVIALDYDGNQWRAVTARCRRSDGREYEVAACEVMIPSDPPGADYFAAYRQWMGLEPYPPAEPRVRDTRLPAGAAASVDLHEPVKLVVLSVKQRTARFAARRRPHLQTARRPPLGRGSWRDRRCAAPQTMELCRRRILVRVIESTRIEASMLGPAPSSSTEAHGIRASITGARKESQSRSGPSRSLAAAAGVRDGAGPAGRGPRRSVF